MQYVLVIIFSNFKLKTLKKIKLDSKARFVFAKRDNYIFFIYLFNLQENIEGHYTKSNYWLFSRSHRKQFFSVKLTQNLHSAPGWNKKENLREKKAFQEAIETTEDLELVSQTKIAYGDFLKRC